MPEATPRPSLRRFALPAAVVASFAAGAVLTWAVTRAQAPEAPPEPPLLGLPPPVPPPAPPLSRKELLAAAAAAAAAYAADAAAPADQAALVGRRFQVRVPFGCQGPQAEPDGAQAWWSYDPARQTLTLTARPVVWTEASLVRQAAAGQDVEAVEGFWIPRPWTDAETCPPRRAAPAPAPAPALAPAGETAPPKAASQAAPQAGGPAAPQPAPPPAAPPSPQTLGLASFFKAGGSRVLRRGDRPYEVVRKLSPEDLAARRDFRLVLTGRIAAVRDGQPIACHSPRPDQRPTCLVAVEFDHVAFEDSAGETLAEWRS